MFAHLENGTDLLQPKYFTFSQGQELKMVFLYIFYEQRQTYNH